MDMTDRMRTSSDPGVRKLVAYKHKNGLYFPYPEDATFQIENQSPENHACLTCKAPECKYNLRGKPRIIVRGCDQHQDQTQFPGHSVTVDLPLVDPADAYAYAYEAAPNWASARGAPVANTLRNYIENGEPYGQWDCGRYKAIFDLTSLSPPIYVVTNYLRFRAYACAYATDMYISACRDLGQLYPRDTRHDDDLDILKYSPPAAQIGSGRLYLSAVVVGGLNDIDVSEMPLSVGAHMRLAIRLQPDIEDIAPPGGTFNYVGIDTWMGTPPVLHLTYNTTPPMKPKLRRMNVFMEY